jgi:histidinol-phosphatase (PHP family)
MKQIYDIRNKIHSHIKRIFTYLSSMWSNFHTHSAYCDGKGALVDYVDAAHEIGIGRIGFSSHAPLPFPSNWCMRTDAFPVYLREIESLRAGYPQIEIYKGLEIDFVPGLISPLDFKPHLDYTIGSIHFVEQFAGKHWEIDNTLEVFREGLSQIFDNNIRSAIKRYYELTRQMVNDAPPDIVGHLDKIKIHNSGELFFNESEGWYRDEIDKTVAVIRETGSMVEVNTRGLYKKKSPTTYPSPWILERILTSRIPVTINSDAHHPDDLIREFEPTIALLKDIGFKNISILTAGIWKAMPLNEYGAAR